MELIDNKSKLLGDDLKREITSGAKIKMVASYFSIYAFESLKKSLAKLKNCSLFFRRQLLFNKGLQIKYQRKHVSITYQSTCAKILFMVRNLKYDYAIS